MSEKLEVIITGESRSAVGAIDSVGKSSSALTSVMSILSPSMSKTASGIETTVGAFTKLAPQLGVSTAAATEFGVAVNAAIWPIAAVVAVLAVATAAFVGFAKVIDFSTQEAEAAEVAQAQLGAVIKSTGGIAGISAEQINSLASELSAMSGVEDDLIVSSSNVLLRFTSISEDMFPKAQQAALDLSVAMGTDLSNASTMLGVALEKPSEGATRLRRSGIVLSEQLIATMRNMEENGRIAKAQGLLLEEVAKRVGGSAQAMGATVQGEQNKIGNLLKNMAEEFGKVFTPLKGDFLVIVRQFLTEVSKNIEPALVLLRNEVRQFQQVMKDPEMKKNIDAIVQSLGQLFGEVAITAVKIFSSEMRDFMHDWRTNGPAVAAEIKRWVDDFVVLAKTVNRVLDLLDRFGLTTRDLRGGAFGVTTGLMRDRNSPGYASGVTNAPGGLSWVGERGPEMMYVPRGANIYPSGSAPAAASGGLKIYGPTYISANNDTTLSNLLRQWEAAATATA